MPTVFDLIDDDVSAAQRSPAPEQDSSPPPGAWDLLKKPTGDGQLEDYLNHPLNVSSSAGLAQVIRGLTGLLGSLDFAVVDIVLGAFRALMEGRKNAGQLH